MKKSESARKTNAARLLDQAGIHYELIPYEVDENHLSADEVAAKLGEDIAYVYKTIVLRGDRNGYFVCVVRGDSEIDLKEAARIRGGCSPVGMKKPFPTYYQASIADLPYVYVSAGIRGLQLKISPADLIAFTGGHLF